MIFLIVLTGSWQAPGRLLTRTYHPDALLTGTYHPDAFLAGTYHPDALLSGTYHPDTLLTGTPSDTPRHPPPSNTPKRHPTTPKQSPPKQFPPNATPLPCVHARHTVLSGPRYFPDSLHTCLPSIPLCSHFNFYPSLYLIFYLGRHQNGSQQRRRLP